MSDERRMILQMLQEGRLTVEEADRLLEALDTADAGGGSADPEESERAEGFAFGFSATGDFAEELHRLQAEMRRLKEELFEGRCEAWAQASEFRASAREAARRIREAAREKARHARDHARAHRVHFHFRAHDDRGPWE